MKQEIYYDEKYYAWQEAKGRFGGRAELIKFDTYIQASDNVIDFGCGGGFLLANLNCANKIGIEINPVARENCKILNIPAVASIDEVPDRWADKIISNHALEHVLNPYEVLSSLKSKLKPTGSIIFVVPCERIDTTYKDRDINQHLYTWSPMNLGNLFVSAGYEVVECRAFLHRWMPKFFVSQKLLGWNLFHKASWAYGFLFRKLSQVRIIAKLRQA